MTHNPNDAIRETILQYFYDRNANATSERGQRGSQVRISDMKRELREQHGLTQPQVMANLTYLIDSGWVERIEEHRSFETARGTRQPATSVWYKITNVGIDLIEGESSAFRRADPFAGINVTAVGSNVQVGDSNYANTKFNGLPSQLDALRDALVSSSILDETTKLEAAADIETVKMQVAKPTPNRTIVEAAWDGIKNVATAAGLAKNIPALAVHLRELID